MLTPETLAATMVAARAHADSALVKAVARAFRYQRLLDEGRYASITEIAEAERIERGYLGTLLRLTLLAPEIVEGALNGHLRSDTTLPCLEPLPAAWKEQSLPSVGGRPVLAHS